MHSLNLGVANNDLAIAMMEIGEAEEEGIIEGFVITRSNLVSNAAAFGSTTLNDALAVGQQWTVSARTDQLPALSYKVNVCGNDVITNYAADAAAAVWNNSDVFFGVRRDDESEASFARRLFGDRADLVSARNANSWRTLNLAYFEPSLLDAGSDCTLDDAASFAPDTGKNESDTTFEIPIALDDDNDEENDSGNGASGNGTPVAASEGGALTTVQLALVAGGGALCASACVWAVAKALKSLLIFLLYPAFSASNSLILFSPSDDLEDDN